MSANRKPLPPIGWRELVHLPEVVSEGLRDCRECRGPNGECTIDDGYRELFLDKALAADALVYATPLWWYGLSGHLKNFLDRMFCYISEGCPEAERVMGQLVGKRAALVISAEESNFSARLAVVHQMQETCRYLHHTLVGIVVGTVASIIACAASSPPVMTKSPRLTSSTL